MSETQRRRFVVCYDVREPKRLRKTHETMLGYGDPLQYSVFVCNLSSAEQVLMQEALIKVVKLPEDSVHIIDLGIAHGRALRRIHALGSAVVPVAKRYRVV